MTTRDQSTRTSVPWYQSLQTKITITLILVTTGILAAFSIYNLNAAGTQLDRELRTLADTTAERLSMNIEGAFWALNDEQIQEQLTAEMLERRIYAVILRDRDLEKMYMGFERDEGWNIQSTSEAPQDDYVVNTTEILHDDRVIGQVEVYVSRRFAEAQFDEQLKVEVGRALAIDLAIIVFATVMLRRQIVRPLRSLTGSAEQISAGRLATSISVKSKDEIGMLANATRKLQTSMRMAVERIKRQ